MVAHQATSTILPLASTAAHHAPPCTITTVTMVAHQGPAPGPTRSSSLVQLCTMQHQDTFTMDSHTAAPTPPPPAPPPTCSVMLPQHNQEEKG